MRKTNVSSSPAPTSSLAAKNKRPRRVRVAQSTPDNEIKINKKTESKRISYDVANNKTYTFKHPTTKEPVLVRAESFNLALRTFKELVKTS